MNIRFYNIQFIYYNDTVTINCIFLPKFIQVYISYRFRDPNVHFKNSDLSKVYCLRFVKLALNFFILVQLHMKILIALSESSPILSLLKIGFDI